MKLENLYYGIVDGVKIPDGFYYVGGTRNSGLVISDNQSDENKYKGESIVGTDLQGNQYVWIPVDNISDYKRVAYSTNYATGQLDDETNSEKIKYVITNVNYFIEALPEDEKVSVETYHGYYIGRYEAGDKESTANQKMRENGASTSNTVTVKKGQAPYNYVTKTQAQRLAEGVKTERGYKVTTKLCSSYAWDTAIAFIQKTNSDYGDSSEEGNFLNTTFDYTDITGVPATKNKLIAKLVPTGQTTPVCNIYDMGGNTFEWTTESYGVITAPYTTRGGSFGYYYGINPSGSRGNFADFSSVENSFRVALFM